MPFNTKCSPYEVRIGNDAQTDTLPIMCPFEM